MSEVDKLYDSLVVLEKEGNHDDALFELYEALLDKLMYNDYSFCNLYIKKTLENPLNVDYLVHMLNPLSIVKEKLENWDDLVVRSKEFFIQEKGEEQAKELLSVIL